MHLFRWTSSRLDTIAVVIITIAALLLPPGIYGAVAYSRLLWQMQSELYVNGDAIVDTIAESPVPLDAVQLRGIMLSHIFDQAEASEMAQGAARSTVRLTFHGVDRRTVTTSDTTPPRPAITRSLTIARGDEMIGRLEAQRSLRPLLVNAVWLTLVGLLIAASLFVTLRIALRHAMQRTNDRLHRTQRQLQAIAEVSQMEGLVAGDMEAVARRVTEVGADATGCERVNVWLFNAGETELRCIDLFERSLARHSAGMVLTETDFAHELAIIKSSKYVDASDALNDPRTAGYVEPYIKPLRIKSMLDVSIEASGHHFGLLCFEHVDQPHTWTKDEIAFATRLADKIGFAAVSRARHEAEAALLQRDTLLHAVAVSAAEIFTSASVDEAVPKMLQRLGEASGLDRVLVLEGRPTQDAAPTLRFAWNAPGIPVISGSRFFENPELMTPQIGEWLEPLWHGRIVATDLSNTTGDVKAALGRLGTRSTIIVPVRIDGKYWGQLAFETCGSERAWTDYDREVLQLVAELIANALQRERYVREIANANRIVQNTPTILFRVRGEPSLPMVYVSQNIKLLGHEPAALINSPHLYQTLVHPDDMELFRGSMAHALERESGRRVIEFRLMNSGGEYRWMEGRYTPIRDNAGRLIEIEGLLIDITERKAAEQKIARLARTDPLTGLANRATFNDRLQTLFVSARRGGNLFAVFYLDLDHFKEINDTLGHPVGDRLLVTIGERLKHNIRETDLVARIGGDEFAVLQCDVSGSADAGSLAAKLQIALAEPITISGNELRITSSIGISVYDAETAAPEDLLARADIALYRAKEEGREQYRFHTEDLDAEVREQVAISEDLRMAVKHGELELYYQPQLQLRTNRIVGMEALIRWNHPARGLLLPGVFIPVAERTGNMIPIGEWALDRACRQMSEWRRAGIAPPSIAVNISSAQIRAAGEFVDFVGATLAKWNLEPESLELDVTESMLARAALTQNNALERLQKSGVRISIDDFGTKYSSLDYLKTYRVNRIKLPKPLLDEAMRDADGAAVVRAIVGIAREFGIDIVAQGVENEAQWAFLTATSPATKVQGFYFSAPVPACDAGALLERGRVPPAAAPMPVAAVREA